MTTIDEFRKFGKEMIDYVADYMENIRDRKVTPDVEPGYLAPLIPSSAPEESEDWKEVLKDVERVIMPGITHWNHPNFHGYFAIGTSPPSVVADILSTSLNSVGFNWIASPAYTELEMVMMDWLVKLLSLPEHFLFSSPGPGGGSIQCTASDSTLLSMLAARARHQNEENICFKKLVTYCSDQAHCSVQKAALLAGVTVRSLETDENFSLQGETLLKAIEEDKAKGLIPFHCTVTLGSTPSCAFDNLKDIGPVCEEAGIWLHIDAAYAGAAFICEEFRHLLTGVEYATSFNFNVHKWMLVAFDCSAMWFRDSKELEKALSAEALYLKHDQEGKMPDFRDWQVPLGRRFRALKIWFVLRTYGRANLQEYIRSHVKLAKEFEALICADDMFDVCAPVVMGLVCFRMKGANEMTQLLRKKIFEDGKIYVVPADLKGKYVIRFALVSRDTRSKDIQFAYEHIKTHAKNVLLQFKKL